MYRFKIKFIPHYKGKFQKTFLRNGTSISVKYLDNDKYIVLYLPENEGDYFSPYLVFKKIDNTLKLIRFYPNFRSFLITLFVLIFFTFTEKVNSDNYLFVILILLSFNLIFQFLGGFVAYKKIKKNAFEPKKFNKN